MSNLSTVTVSVSLEQALEQAKALADKQLKTLKADEAINIELVDDYLVVTFCLYGEES